MSSISILFRIHLKYWYVYLGIFVMLIPAYVIALMLGWFITNLGLNEIIAWVISIILGAEIISLPLLFCNYKAAFELKTKKKLKLNLVLLTLLCHIPSLILSFTIFLSILYVG